MPGILLVHVLLVAVVRCGENMCVKGPCMWFVSHANKVMMHMVQWNIYKAQDVNSVVFSEVFLFCAVAVSLIQLIEFC